MIDSGVSSATQSPPYDSGSVSALPGATLAFECLEVLAATRVGAA